MSLDRKGKVGLALWDYGQFNAKGQSFGALDPKFYQQHLRYYLKEFKHFMTAVEFQQEAHFQDPNNHSWYRLDFMGVPGFHQLMLKNRLLSIHARSFGVDISSIDEVHRQWAKRETMGSIELAFKLGADAVTIHPGAYNETVGKSWQDGIQDHPRRVESLKKSLACLAGAFADLSVNFERKKRDYNHLHPGEIEQLGALFNMLHAEDITDTEYYNISQTILDFVEKRSVPVDLVRECRKQRPGIHLCIENIEPPNFLMNSPAQLRLWYSFMTEVVAEAFKKRGAFDLFEWYSPKIVIDIPHFCSSQDILSKTPDRMLLETIIEGYDDFDRLWVGVPGKYFRPDQPEPLINKVMRENESDLLYVHFAGTERQHEGWMGTHGSIRPLRDACTITLDGEGFIHSRYSFDRPDINSGLNTLEALMVSGFEKDYILEVFNKSSEVMIASKIYVDSFLNYMFKLSNECRARLPCLLTGARFFFTPREDRSPGFESAGFYVFDAAVAGKYKILAEWDEEGRPMRRDERMNLVTALQR